MNCLNGAEYLREAIDSIYAQAYTNWEIIFWDNASTDNSAEIAQSYDKRLLYFHGQETVSLGRARNLALEKANGEYIAFLDCDDIWMPEKLEKQIKMFSNERVGLVYSDVLVLNQKNGKETLHYQTPQPVGAVFHDVLKKSSLPTLTVVMRRQCLENISEGFDKRFSLFMDADLFIRIAHEWELGYINEPLAKWRMHLESDTWKKLPQLGREMSTALDKYKLCFVDFETLYLKEITHIKALAAYYNALAAWEHDDKRRVRRIVLPYLTDFPKLIMVFLLSFLPYKWYIKILRFTNKHP